jgi:glycosyltransferase involved in cell wall biosynthesis
MQGAGMTDLVSILIPAYNSERWVGDTIKSALSQTWPNKEIIIVDDGSTDNTLAIVRQFASKSVKVITQENRGASAARNKALSFAQGDYIQWLDADDLLAPDKISQQLKESVNGRKTRILLSSAWGRFYFRSKKAVFVPHSLWRDLLPLKWLLTRFNESIWMHPACWLVSRRLTEMAGPWDERLSFDDDGEYFCRVVSVSEKVKFVRESRCFYRIGNSGSLSANRSDKALESLIISIGLCFDHLRSIEDNKKTKDACLKYLQNRVLDFYTEKREIIEKANDLARVLGGRIVAPKEDWQLVLARKMFGWRTAKKMKSMIWRAEITVRKNWDKLLFNLSGAGNDNV